MEMAYIVVRNCSIPLLVVGSSNSIQTDLKAAHGLPVTFKLTGFNRTLTVPVKDVLMVWDQAVNNQLPVSNY